MRASWKLRMYIGIFFTIFHILCGICFDMVEADLLCDATRNTSTEGMEAFIINSSKEVLIVGLEIRNAGESEVCFHGRMRVVKKRFVQGLMLLLLSALFFGIAHVYRRLLEVSELLLVSAMRNIIFYMHQQDGKKDAPIFF